ncbi:uncharacterized protein LOC119722409 [Patiria miniata]|uniref:Uncharacterized protein n=1 Tax=Patiria miniata TaxID=46514 RepID=A0A913Z9I8_PATMI|nr:uncharacterized protein LOC119722409 [Patiria miniata]
MTERVRVEISGAFAWRSRAHCLCLSWSQVPLPITTVATPITTAATPTTNTTTADPIANYEWLREKPECLLIPGRPGPGHQPVPQVSQPPRLHQLLPVQPWDQFLSSSCLGLPSTHV